MNLENVVTLVTLITTLVNTQGAIACDPFIKQVKWVVSSHSPIVFKGLTRLLKRVMFAFTLSRLANQVDQLEPDLPTSLSNPTFDHSPPLLKT